ncbi:MAG: DUF4349 domain-containing protein [Clostridiales bacterium]|jgi:hypothetical protein|nr:DUF4349 domain-containing protein [Clostridiales bacterium]
MKKIRIATILVIGLIMGFVFTACASKGDYKYDMASPNPNSADGGMAYEYDMEDTKDAVSEEYNNLKNESGLTSTSGITTGYSADLSMDKIITKVNLEVETQEFDELIGIIKDEIVRLGGYDERTEVSGKRYYSRSNSRNGYIVARIPKDRLNDFVEVVKENGNVINESSSSDNVTLQYVDTQSRKKSLEIEQERLWALLEKTEKLEDIVTLESRLSSIRYEIQMYETEIRTIDNKVDYSTVTISVSEVERMTPTEEKETVLTRIKNGFSESIFNITEGLKNFLVWFVVNLPYLIIWAVIITAVVIITRRILRKSKNKNRRFSGAEDRIKETESDK